MAAGEAFSTAQRARIDKALAQAEQQTGLGFSVFVGAVQGGPRVHARELLSRIAGPAQGHVLVYVAPGPRALEIVTTPAARERLSDQACALATLSMTTSFSVGDLVGGIVNGLRMMADATTAPLSSAS